MKVKLNKDQLRAVKHKSGPLLIIAGAGTGKTTVITERIKYLISKNLAKPDQILALTFTEKASREMETRVDEIMPLGETGMWISTFHSFCDRILRDESLQIGLDPSFTLMTQAQNLQLIGDNLFEFDLSYFRPRGNPNKFISGLQQHFSRLQDENISPDEYSRWSQAQSAKRKVHSGEEKLELAKYKELANAFKQYEELKISKSVLDYGDLIVKTLELFNKRPNILKKYQDQFRYILVDEFQDTNFAQSQLVYLLAGKKANITVVGDDDQSIYRFRGAAVSNILQFSKRYPRSTKVVLNQNYRSYQQILDRAYNLIQFNNPDRLEVMEKVDKKLISDKRDKKTRVFLIHKRKVEQEAEAVGEKIINLVQNKKYKLSDIAVLVRANNHATVFTNTFERMNIPYQFLGLGKLFDQKEIQPLIAFLKIVNDIDDSISFYNLLNLPDLTIDQIDIIRLTSFAKKRGMSLFEAAENLENIKLSTKAAEKINKLRRIIIDAINQSRLQKPGVLLHQFVHEMKILENLASSEDLHANVKAQNIANFFEKLGIYELHNNNATASSVVDWIELSSEFGETNTQDQDWWQEESVKIMTIHAAKGLEFPVVFLVNLVSQRFPSTQRNEQIPLPDSIIKETLPQGDFHIQEERRLFYVGETRAKDYLYLTAADYYSDPTGSSREKKLSSFIFEALGDKMVKSEEEGMMNQQLTLLDFAPKHDSSPSIHPSDLHVHYLSYSQIETFKTCPLHYKLRYIINLPTEPSSVQSLGVSVHGALKDFYLEIKAGSRPTKKLLLKNLDNNWQHDGYKNKKYEKISLERGREYLSGYFESEFDKDSLPILVEHKFNTRLSQPGQKALQIGGVMDRVNQLPNGKIEILDYKTGEKLPSQTEVDKNEQLTFYALAASKIANLPFGKKPNQIKLSLYYFEEQKKITTTRTQTQLSQFEAELFKIRHEIEMSDFTCSGSFWCQNCEYKQFCSTSVDKL